MQAHPVLSHALSTELYRDRVRPPAAPAFARRARRGCGFSDRWAMAGASPRRQHAPGA
jgi:hypothetical protein